MAEPDCFSEKMKMLKHKPNVIVVGGGIAGIATADVLVRFGIPVKVLEATERTGGRIWSIDVDVDESHQKCELGANWIHGIERNPIYQIADKNNLLELRNRDKGLRHQEYFFTEDGERVDKKLVKATDWTYGMLMQQSEEFYQMNVPTPEENDSVGAFLARGFEQKLDRYSGAERQHRELVFQQRLAQEAINSGSYDFMHDVSLSEIGSYEELPGVHYIIPPGFETVLDLLKKNIPSEDILVNHSVKTISYDCPNGRTDRKRVCVECENGQKFYADHVIVTISLGCLKNCGNRFFSPPLPAAKQDAIHHLEIGIVDKVILEFEEPVVNEDMRSLTMLRDYNTIQQEDIKDSWQKKIHSWDIIDSQIMIGWIVGHEAKYMETLTEEEVAVACVGELRKFLGKSNIPMPKKVIRTSWGTNPYTRGSYSFIPVGGSVTDIETLMEPLPVDSPQPCLLFAGEATHPSFYSTTHGALLTGHREAQRIIDMYTE